MVTTREDAIIAFLAQHDWQGCQRHKIPGDASFRSYERLEKNGNHAILMDAPPPKEDVRPFVNIANYLNSLELSAPNIMAADEEQGFLILEDLGNDSFTKLLNNTTATTSSLSEEPLYQRAVDVLIHIHNASHLPENLPPYDESVLEREVLLLIDWYLPFIGLYNKPTLTSLREEFLTIWRTLYPLATDDRQVMVCRDYHADNLMWLSERGGAQAVGLLDFQDALLGSQAYDLVSLLEDARRDVSLNTQEKMIHYFIEKTGDIDPEQFRTSYAMLGAQRNIKIIGIFCRLAIRDGKERYLSYLPRVWKHLERDLSHPALAALKQWVDRIIPQDKRHAESIRFPKKEAMNA